MSSFYRREALEAQASPPYGRVILAQPLSFVVLTGVAVLLTATVVLFFFLGSYTKYGTVSGQLLPDGGLIKVYPPESGVLIKRYVKENQRVKAGDVMFVISGQSASSAGGDKLLRSELGLSTDAESSGASGPLDSKVAELRSQLEILKQQIESQQQLVDLSKKTFDSYHRLLSKKYISMDQLRQKQVDLLSQQAHLQDLRRERITLMHQLGTQYQVVVAPETGTATSISADIGQSVSNRRPLLRIVPADAKLHADLYAPSRAIGFIRAGDRVLLRYEAYPYQKFGLHGGTVSWVSKTAVAAAESNASDLNPATGEPLYEIRVKLDDQSIKVYGKHQALQASMSVKANVLQERRHIYEWALDPLLSLSH